MEKPNNLSQATELESGRARGGGTKGGLSQGPLPHVTCRAGLHLMVEHRAIRCRSRYIRWDPEGVWSWTDGPQRVKASDLWGSVSSSALTFSTMAHLKSRGKVIEIAKDRTLST